MPTLHDISYLSPLLALAKVTLLLLALFAIAAVLRGRAPEARHVLWVVGLAAIVAMPFLSAGVPWRVNIAPVFRDIAPASNEAIKDTGLAVTSGDAATEASPFSSVDAARASKEPPAPAVTDAKNDLTAHAGEPTVTGTVSPDGRSLRDLLLIVWLAGILFVIVRFAIGVATLSWFARRAEPAELNETVARLCERLGVKRRVRVLVSPLAGMPITWGVFRPVVLLPSEYGAWSEDRLHAVLLHELSHVRRRDAIWHTLSQLACAVYWFHPLVWFAARKLELESERACDSIVTGTGVSRKRYATHLVDFARQHDFETAPAALMPMARRSQLRRRLESVLAGDRTARMSRRAAATIVLCVVMAASAVAALQVEPQKWTDREWGGGDSTRQKYAGSMFKGRVKTFVLNDDAYTMAKWHKDGSTYRMEMEGTVHVGDDDNRIASISRDGFIVMEETDGKHKRRYEAYPSDDGGIREEMYESKSADELGDADAWLAKMVLLLVRRTGLDADGRVERILDAKGPDGVLDEIGRLSSDHVRGLYFRYLLELGDLDGAEMSAATKKIGEAIDSDGDKTRLLVDIADRFMDDPELTRAFFEASESISSDGDRRRLINAIMERDTVPPSTVMVALRSIGGISSDGDQAFLLARAAELYKLEGDVARAFFEALESVHSDGDHSRVLIRVISQDDLSEETQRLVLRSAAEISSDGDQARVLKEFVSQYGVGESVSGVFFDAVDRISSDGDCRSVLIEVCSRSGLSERARLDLLQSTERISSSGDKAAVLMAAASQYQDDDTLRKAYLETARTISSDNDYRRVMRRFQGAETAR